MNVVFVLIQVIAIKKLEDISIVSYEVMAVTEKIKASEQLIGLGWTIVFLYDHDRH